MPTPTQSEIGGADEGPDLRKQIDDFGNAALRVADERNAAIACLRKIANWRGYSQKTADHDLSEAEKLDLEYERGANDMLEGLAIMARETLSDMGLSS